MKEMVVRLTAFALRRENSATWSGGWSSPGVPPGSFPQLRERLHSWMARGKVKLKFCHPGEREGNSSERMGAAKPAGSFRRLPDRRPHQAAFWLLNYHYRFPVTQTRFDLPSRSNYGIWSAHPPTPSRQVQRPLSV